jgi:beta-galactosidase
MKKTISILLFIFIGNVILALPSIVNSTSSAHQRLTLNKGWRFHKGDIPFPEIKGQEMSYDNAKAGTSWGAAAPNYDDSDWRLLNLPHDWAVEGAFDPNANIAQGYRERGIGWYRRTFKLLDEDKGKHIELQFDGIATYATIWVNGTILHRNFCGYTSMYIDITPYAKYGENINTVAVRVDANPQEGWWYEGAGMYRNAWLIKRSPLHIITDGVFAHPVKQTDSKWNIPVEVTLNNIGEAAQNATIDVGLYDASGNLVVSGKQISNVQVFRNITVKLNLEVVNPQLWELNNPVLYTVKTKVIANGVTLDQLNTKCGFRTVRFDSKSGFFLNDKNIKIKGVCNHQDHAGVGVALPDGIWEFRLRKLKEMGVNAYRVAHNPPSNEFLNICDSIGMMVFDENRVFNTSPEYTRQLEWMVRRDRNRPSVILWSVFNEEPMQATSNGYEMARRMSDVVKQLDTTRPVTAAMNGGFFSPLNVGHAVDLVGTNYQIKDYDRFHEQYPDKAFTSSEDGSAFMTRGEFKTDKTKNIMSSYDTEAAPWGATHRNAWKQIAERPFMAGCFYWTGFDYRGEPTPFQWPSTSSFFGIMDLCGFPKTAYFIHQAQWIDDKPVVNIAPHWNWPNDTIGKPIQVMVMSNTDSVVLKLNGKLIGGQKVDRYEMNSWNVAYKPGKLEAFAFTNGKMVARNEVNTTGKAVQLRLTPDRKSLSANGTDAMPITVEVLDAKGRAVPTAQQKVTFSITGPAQIIGLGNGDPNCHEAEKGNERSLFNGLAQVIIQATETNGEVLLTATAPGMKPTTLRIPVSQAVLEPFVAIEYPSILLDKWRISPITLTRPDPNIVIADNDMNSWEPIGNGTLTKVAENEYFVLRTTFKTGKYPQASGNILFKKVTGEAEVWLNGKLIGKKGNAETADFTVSYSTTTEMCDLRILFKSTTESAIGIAGSTELQVQ